jgi:putative membrane protein
MQLHPFTAVRDAVLYGIRLGSLGFFAGAVGQTVGAVPLSLVFVLAPVGFLAGAGYGVAHYLAFEYELDASTLTIRSGVLRRQARQIPLERVQNVDVEQSFLARPVGLAVVRFETAGGGSTEGEIGLVGKGTAESMQADLRRHKRERRSGGAAPAAGAAVPEPEVLYELSTRELAVLAAVSFRWGTIPLVGFSTPLADDLLERAVEVYVVPVILGGEVSLADPRLLGVGLTAIAGFLLVSWLLSAAITVTQYHGFRLARLDDELVYERGLVRRYSGTVPLSKVQTAAVEENLAMRRLGYAALSVETAGYAPGGDGGRAPSAVPLAPRATVRDLVDSIEGVDDLGVERPPSRARRRYVGRFALLAGGLVAVFAAVHLAVRPLGVLWALPLAALVVAAPAGHLRWANRGHRVQEDHLVTRSGFWRRTSRVVPYYRLQTVVTERSVFQRRWDLASVVADTAAASTLRSSTATAYDLDEGDASALHDHLRDGLLADLAERRAAEQAERARRQAAGTAGSDGVTEEGTEGADGGGTDGAEDGEPHGVDPGGTDGADGDATTDAEDAETDGT